MAAQKMTPKFATQAPNTPNEFLVRVAIDFGTDGVALAYAFGKSNHVESHAEWSAKKYKPKFKPKTIILLDENGNALGFGKDAKHTYMAVTSRKDKWLLFERFKMSLYTDDSKEEKEKTNRKIPISDTLTATNGKTISSSVVFIAAFKHLQKQAKDYLKRNKLTRNVFKTLKDCDYQWIITVPAIWNDEAKYRMRQWTIDAGLVDPKIHAQCKIVYEPDCCSLAIQYEIRNYKANIKDPENNDVKQEDNDVKQEDISATNFEKGEKYILVDAGGGTTDIACHEILGGDGEYGVKELLPPSGGCWGSCYIDDQFIKMLSSSLFKQEWIDEFTSKRPDIYTELLDNFQKAKIGFYDHSKEEKKTVYNVRLPYDFIGFIQDKLEELKHENEELKHELEDFVSAAKIFGKSNLVKLNDQYLEIENEAWEIMFDYVVTPTINHIKKLLNNPKLMNSNCKYLCLCGGLSTSPYFQYKMRQEFGMASKYKMNLIIPIRPILCVVEGAAYFGITPNYIKARILKYTYGEGLCITETKAKKLNIDENHIKKNKRYVKIHDAYYVDDCFHVLARKNEEIFTGQIKTSIKQKSRISNDAIITYVLCSGKEYPKTLDDGQLLGEIENKWHSEDKNDCEIVLEFHFYDTLIKAVTYRKSKPNEKTIRYITNCV